jgi:hypothetical protein
VRRFDRDFGVRPYEERHLRIVEAPHRVDAEGDLQIVSAQDGFVAREILRVGVRRDADVRDIEQPSAPGRCRASLDAVTVD